MYAGPSSSKRIKYGEPNYEDVLQKWFDEAGSDNSDIESECDETFAIESDHESDFIIHDNMDDEKPESTDSRESVENENEERVRESNYYYGKKQIQGVQRTCNLQ